ncbi:hypothetical protein [Lactobacillus phage JNU_P5]|nr:hypothetical protein [Lactobacillus phage JNU_P5]
MEKTAESLERQWIKPYIQPYIQPYMPEGVN